METIGAGGPTSSELARKVEALLFVSPHPVPEMALAEACEVELELIEEAVGELEAAFAPGRRGLVLRRVSGGLTLATDPAAEGAARRLLAKPRTPPLTQAQAETLSIVAYLQPVARPEIARIRGVSSESAVNSLSERGLIEEAGRSRFGATIYRTSGLFEKVFGLEGLDGLPDPSQFDPTPEDERAIRERLLAAGEQRAEQ
ncbi:MAG: SMC-Scp complex subunit ScpB [Solirubrobacterales bacterium]|nr:SMC-Scp complex subunit ScpB [Solirubrobacterales bacterium]